MYSVVSKGPGWLTRYFRHFLPASSHSTIHYHKTHFSHASYSPFTPLPIAAFGEVCMHLHYECDSHEVPPSAGADKRSVSRHIDGSIYSTRDYQAYSFASL